MSALSNMWAPIGDARFPSDLAVFANVARFPGGPEWIAAVPSLVAELEQEWGIVAGEAFVGGTISWVAPAVDSDGRELVLKVAWPHAEQRTEMAALAMWNGTCAPALLRVDPCRHAMLLERVLPGDQMHAAELPAEALVEQCGELARQLWVHTSQLVVGEHGFDTLARRLGARDDEMPERFERLGLATDSGLASLARELFHDLTSAGPCDRLLHGDMHPGNIISAQRAAWLVIDPKPLVGDPSHDAQLLLPQLGIAIEHHLDPVAEIRARYSRFAVASGEPLERLLGWGVLFRAHWLALNFEQLSDASIAHALTRARWFADALLA